MRHLLRRRSPHSTSRRRAAAAGSAIHYVPLCIELRRYGTFALGFPRVRHLTAGERAFLLAVSCSASQALDRARLLDDLARAEASLRFVSDADAVLAGSK